MNDLSTYNILSTSLSAEGNRLEAVAFNLAMINETYGSQSDVPGAKYIKVKNFPDIKEAVLGGATEAPSAEIRNNFNRVDSVLEVSGSETITKFKTAIKLEEQMMFLNEATRAYEASIRLFNLQKEMNGRLLSLGGNS
ncbi:hypothetical protein RN22_01375 [Grimontia sp. AD028]|uniref:Flagellar basal body rod protein FlgC n=1 Tax=Grimontia celer TaxID=1796497 RepID=A0A128F8M6_9GAMM|nr:MULTISPECIES: hypothetical protein [Grimontia]KKD62284.1 hypothetical protein RN22_01375 [Grimontia sp. AD028]CZF82656.1 flagellar basal body rod protein FlgC [Grimontia celer]